MACAEHAAGTDWSFEQNVALELPLLPARSLVLPAETQAVPAHPSASRFCAKDHPLVLLDDQFQMFNLLAGRFYLLAGQLLLFEQLVVLGDHHLLQCFGIERIEVR